MRAYVCVQASILRPSQGIITGNMNSTARLFVSSVGSVLEERPGRAAVNWFLSEAEGRLALLRSLDDGLGDGRKGLRDTGSCSPASGGLEGQELRVLSRGETMSRIKLTGASLLGVIPDFTHHGFRLPGKGLPVHESTVHAEGRLPPSVPGPW